MLKDLRWLSFCPKFANISEDKGSSVEYYNQWFVHATSNHKSMSKHAKAYARERIANVPTTESSLPSSCGALSHCCFECNASFETFQKLCLHQFKKHGFKNIWKTYIGSFTYCTVCLKQFWSRERLLNHIRYRSKICKHNLQMRGPICDNKFVNELDEADAETHVSNQFHGLRRHEVRDPVVQLQGPVQPILNMSELQSSHRLGFGHNNFLV